MLPSTVDSPRTRHPTLHAGGISEQLGLGTGTNTRTQPPFKCNDRERNVPVLRRQTRMDYEGRLYHPRVPSSPRHGQGDIFPIQRGYVGHVGLRDSTILGLRDSTILKTLPSSCSFLSQTRAGRHLPNPTWICRTRGAQTLGKASCQTHLSYSNNSKTKPNRCPTRESHSRRARKMTYYRGKFPPRSTKYS